MVNHGASAPAEAAPPAASPVRPLVHEAVMLRPADDVPSPAAVSPSHRSAAEVAGGCALPAVSDRVGDLCRHE